MQTWNAACYAKNVRFVSELGDGVLQWLQAKPGEKILDLGCGDGVLTLRLANLGCEVLGVDASSDMVAATRELGVDAEQISGEELPFEARFDAVFSNAALHWMRRADRVAAGVMRALRPGGRFVAEFGGGHNVATVVAALQDALRDRGLEAERFNPWYFPQRDEYQALLQHHGFAVSRIELFERPTRLPGHVRAWLETFAQSFLAVLEPAQHDGFLTEVCARLEPRLFEEGRGWTVDYVRLRLEAYKPA